MGTKFSLAFVVDHHRLDSLPQRSIDENLDNFSYPCLFVLSLHSHHFNMSNGTVNGTGLETQFGEFLSHSSRQHVLTRSDVRLPASLGINGTKSTYVPPHMRGQQRAASSPAVPTNG